jgi:hypothetical protein
VNKRNKPNLKESRVLDELRELISNDFALIPSLIATLSTKSTDRFKAAKILQLISQIDPAVIYPYFEVFIKLLDSSSSVLLWNSIIIISYLVEVDTNHRFDNIFGIYYHRLWEGKLVTAANILASSGRIARCRPDLADKITAELLKVDDIPLPTPECREVARSHVLNSFAEYPELLKQNKTVKDFIARCATSHRPAVKKKAEELILLFGQMEPRPFYA